MQDEMRALVNRLNETARAYYVDDNPLISDTEWDALYDRLRALEERTGVRLPDSPTLRVGGEPLEGFEPHRHVERLWSMDKTQSPQELSAWFDRTRRLAAEHAELPTPSYMVEYKLDGLTINLTYEDGVLRQAATRGNGVVGEAILAQARTIHAVPLSIPYRGFLEVQGECVMPLSALKAYNETADEPLKNARNAAAGALRNLDPAVTASRRLTVYFYQTHAMQDPPFSDQGGMLAFLRENGFPVSPLAREACDERQAMEIIEKIERERAALDFLIDGAVIKLCDFASRAALGYTDKFPRWAVAYKFAAEEATTTIERVTWEAGRTGKLTPLAHVQPVSFSGVTVTRATLNNPGDIERKRLTVGARVFIRRSNDVIPEILGCTPDSPVGAPILTPERCPACMSPVEMRGANLYCTGREGCRAQAVQRLKHFASRDAMDIETFSERTADALWEADLTDERGEAFSLRDPADLYRLTAGSLRGLPGFQQKRAENLVAQIRESRACKLDAFLFALGIPNVGRKTARDLALALRTLPALREATVDQLTQIPDVGGVVAASVTEFFGDAFRASLVDRLLSAGVEPEPIAALADEPARALPFMGQSIVVTGTLPTLSRAQAEKLIEENGGVAAGSVSKKTAFVVAGEKAGGKLDKALALGVPVIDEAELLKRVNHL